MIVSIFLVWLRMEKSGIELTCEVGIAIYREAEHIQSTTAYAGISVSS